MLDLKSISKTFGAVRALDEVSISFRAGEIHALLGENGAGKSTLATIIGGATVQDSGQLLLDDESVSISSPATALKQGISVVYQHLNLAEELTVAANLYLAREPRGLLGMVSEIKMNRAAAVELDRIGADFTPDTLVKDLSIGDRQLAEIARALSHKPRFLIMDEPTASLSAKAADQVFEVIHDLRNQGACILYITHELDHVFQHADRLSVLKDGEWMMTSAVSEVGRNQVIETMVGRRVEALFPAHGATPSSEVAPILEVEGLSLEGYFDDISFILKPGEVVGFGGLVGSGRTRLARAIFGDLPEHRTGPLKGKIQIDGHSVRIRSPRHAVQLGVGLVPEDRISDGMVQELSVAANISLPQVESIARAGFIDRSSELGLAQQQIESLGIKVSNPETEVKNLSGGNQQKVILGKWLARGCKVLILDEPTPGVDVGAKAEIYELVREAADSGAAVMLISSDLPELIGMSDRICVMSRGRIVAEYRGVEATEESVMKAAFGDTSELEL